MIARLGFLSLIAAVSLTAQTAPLPTLTIIWPTDQTIVSGATPIEVSLQPVTPVKSIRFTVGGREVCTVQRRPYRCSWNPGAVVKSHLVRVIAELADGRSVAASVQTKGIGHAEHSRADAVLVPVIVRDGGEFVRGLRKEDFEVFEDGVPQTITSLISEEAPLDLVLAVDVSGSMESALDEVKAAVKQFFARLRAGDAATLVGFNDTLFVAAEREPDPELRSSAVDLLGAWGGTAIYDATVRVLDMVTRDNSRKGVVIFSDGADQDSLTTRDAAMRRVQSSDAMLYTIGFGAGLTVPSLRRNLTEYAESTGGRAFFPTSARALDGVFTDIITELANQYVLSYAPTNLNNDGAWRTISVRVGKGKYKVRARQGYLPQAPRRGGP
jgi:Ca-activated chloride channel family protein